MEWIKQLANTCSICGGYYSENLLCIHPRCKEVREVQER